MSALLRSLTPGAIIPECEGERLYLRLPQLSDHAEWAKLRSESREFLEPWEPRWSSSALSRIDFRRRLRRYARDVKEDRGIAFFIFRQDKGNLIGGVSLSNIRRGVTQSCSLGYWIGEKHARQGFMTEAVTVIIRYVFNILHLNRLEAACVPENTASMGVLKKTGFAEEGLARKYIRINGVWRDHILFAILSSDSRMAIKYNQRAVN